MATNVDNSTKTKEKVGPASVTVSFGEDKELKIGSFSILDNGDVLENPLKIGELKVHECIYDESKNIAKRNITGEDGSKKEVKVKPESIEKFKRAAEEQAKKQQKEDKDR